MTALDVVIINDQCRSNVLFLIFSYLGVPEWISCLRKDITLHGRTRHLCGISRDAVESIVVRVVFATLRIFDPPSWVALHLQPRIMLVASEAEAEQDVLRDQRPPHVPCHPSVGRVVSAPCED